MSSFDSQLPYSNASYTEGGTVDSFHVSDFDQSVGYCLEDAVGLTGMISGRVARAGGEASCGALQSPLTNDTQLQSLQVRKAQSSNLVTILIGNTENQEEFAMAEGSPITDISTDGDTDDKNQRFDRSRSLAAMASDSGDRSKNKSDQKTLRRLAQNREAARKSRLRKKAYVQQLESSRLKFTQLEQELQRARQQGIFISSSGDQAHSMSGNGAMAFDVEYARWLEEQNRQINELRGAVNSHASETELHMIMDGILAHYDEIFRLKGIAAKADVFHLLSGMWKTPAERCFLWLGGFRSSELLKLLINQLEPLTDQQLVGITNLQQSSQEAEDALSQGMEALQQSLSETLTTGPLGSSSSSGNVANYMGQMAMAMGKLGTLEGFIRQADNLRQQTLQQIHRILTTRQSARALLAIHDYFSRLRALSSLWLARPRE
ncbi:transcription factor TGA2.2 isoform X2 [Cicer arietinum]|uniref:Transcription factor TGA2.2 isoform X2 n=1 Tax=Cicer arietinum TaxID=3827 RepID=A0A1S3E5J4_CICAR|nr:transcription factor TGA2.2 isoform X2 [Cicer arietinum]XP_012570693.1 transcription factor TGA2.2 isoform X2 [Cicer arietinum]